MQKMHPIHNNIFKPNAHQEQKRFDVAKKQIADELISNKDINSMSWKKIFELAHQQKASDIHIESDEDKILVKTRVSGILKEIKCFEGVDTLIPMIQRLKSITGLDTSTATRACDSAFNFNYLGMRYRVASACNVSNNEDIVIRCIYDDWEPNFITLNLYEETEKVFREAIDYDEGMIIVTGPTGSGKSSTLQACMIELASQNTWKITSLEDPVERRLRGVRHFPITKDMSWSQGIKFLMRADPDVILVGEIRDDESANLAFEAASTGHLVLTTLHTASVAGIVERLTGKKVPMCSISDNLILATAQRLFPKLCDECKIKNPGGFFSLNLKGCENCNNIGAKGRASAIEYANEIPSKAFKDFDRDYFHKNYVTWSLRKDIERLSQLGIVDCNYLHKYR